MVSRAIVGEWDARVQGRILDVGVSAAVVLIGAALRREIVDAAATRFPPYSAAKFDVCSVNCSIASTEG